MDNQTDPATAGAPTDQPVYGPPPVETTSRSDEINPQKGYGGPANIGSPAQNIGAIGSAIASAPATIAKAPAAIGENEAAPATAVGDTFSPVGADTWANFQDGLRNGAYSAETDQRQFSLQDSVDAARENIRKAAGVDIPNPYVGAFAASPTAMQDYQNSLQQLLADHQGDTDQDKAIRDAVTPALNMDQYADQWVKDSQSKAQMDIAKSNGTLLPWLAQQGGSMAGSFRNPINLLGLAVGGPELGIGGSAIGRVLQEGVSQAAIQMGLTGVQEPGHQARAAQLGEDHGFWPVMHDLEDSALGGFIGGSVIKGLHEIGGHFFGSADQGVATEEFLRRAQDIPPPGGWPAGSESRGEAWRREMDEWAAKQSSSKGEIVPYEGPDGSGESVGFAGPPPNEPSVAARAAQAQQPPKLNTPPEIANLPHTTAVTPAGIEARELDAAAPPPYLPADLTRNDALETYAGTIRAAENPDQVAKPLAPPRTPDALPASDPQSLALPPVAETKVGATFIKDDKPITREDFDPTKLQTNADVFQYKGGGNAAGVTDRLKGVGQWDPIAGSDPMVVYQWGDGREDVVNGHQRTGLAKALDAQGSLPEGTRTPGFVFKEADGWTPQDVRAYAAKVNLMQGSGDVMDSARILRDRPDIWDKSLPTSDIKLKQAKGLAELSDDGWGMVLNGHVKPNLAALVGQGVPDKSAHTDLLQNIIDFKNADENSTRMMIADANAAGFREEEQSDIFGATPVTKSLLRERAEVYSRVIQALRDNKKVFGLLDREAERIEAAGNSLVTDVNAAQADRATQLANILEKLAVRQGPVSAALNRAATSVAVDKTPARTAAQAFLRDIDRLMREEGLKLTPPPIPEPRTNLDLTTTPGQEQATEELRQATAALSDDIFGSHTKTIPEQRQAIFDDMVQKLTAADVPRVQTEANAAVMAARYVARASRLGRSDPETLYREQGLTVRGDAQRASGEAPAKEGAMVLNQPVTVPTFYSSVARAVDNAKLNKASPEQWLATLKNLPAVKPEEVKWLGLEDWVKGQKGPITKDQVADYVRANQIRVTEVQRGGEPSERFQNADEAVEYLAGLDGKSDAQLRDEFPYYDDAAFVRLANESAQIENEENGGTKFGGYKLPGGENYREMLLTLPPNESEPRLTGQELAARNGLRWEGMSGYERQTYKEEAAKIGRDDFISSHWEEPNVLAHIRFDDRETGGKRTLHLAEVQSDWHQAGRKRGYSDPAELPRRDAARREAAIKSDAMIPRVNEMLGRNDQLGFDTLNQARAGLAEDYRNYDLSGDDLALAKEYYDARADKLDTARAYELAFEKRGVPEAPFKTTWPELSMKRMIRYAAENGYERVTWDTGKTNAERYDLSKQVDRVTYDPKSQTLRAFKDGRTIVGKTIAPEKLEDELGKDAADRLLKQPLAQEDYVAGRRAEMVHTIQGDDLKVGGAGMDGFYDKMLPAVVDKLTKKFGGKTGWARVIHDEETGKGEDTPFDVKDAQGNVVGTYHDENYAMAQAEKIGGTYAYQEQAPGAKVAVPVHSLTLTPELKDAALNEGFPLFAKASDAEPRGRITMRDDSAVVDLFKKKNASTFMHEAGHKFLEEMASDAGAPNAPKQIKDDFKTTLDWLGAKDAESISEAQHEKFAKGFEQYLREGKAPSEGLRRAFEQFKEWLRAIYRSLVGLGKEIPDAIRGVMDRMIATDDEIAAARAAEHEQARTAPPTQQELAGAQLDDGLRDVAAHVDAALRADGTPLDHEIADLIQKELGAPPPAPEPGAKPIEREPAARPGTKLDKTVDMRATGLRPKAKGDAASSIQTAQAAWALAKQTGRPAVAALGDRGWATLKPTDAIPESAPYLEVTPEGVARFYGSETGENPKPPANNKAQEPAWHEKTAAGDQIGMPGVKPVSDADRARFAAEQPLRGGDAAPPAGGLFDEDAKAQVDWMDLVPTDDGLVPASELKEQLKPASPEEKTFFQSAKDMFGRPVTQASLARQNRQKALALYAQGNLVKYFNGYRTLDGRRDIASAAYDLFEDFGHSGHPSVRFLAESLTARTNAKIADTLEHFARKTFYSDGSLVGGRRNRVELVDLQRALFGEKTTPDMQAMAKGILDALDEQRMLFNEKAGDTIPHLANWGGPQSHNASAVYRAGGAKTPAAAKANWIAYIDPLLNWTQMRDARSGGIYNRPPELEERQQILGSAWENIVSDGNLKEDAGENKLQPTSVANSRSDSRFFVFKDADSKAAYNRNYGEGDLLTQIAGHVRLMARDTALMTILGPNPRAMTEWMQQGIVKEFNKYKIGKPALVEGYKYDNDYLDAKATNAAETVAAYYQQFRGSNYNQGKVALAGTMLKNLAMGALLGSSSIPHVVSNPFIQMTARYYGGVPVMRAIPQILTSFTKSTKEEMLRSGLDLENGAYSLGESARYIRKMQRWANATRWFPDRVSAWSGLHPFVEANRSAMRRDMVGMFADLQKTDWSQLPRAVLTKLKGYGLNEGDWKIAQTAQPYKPTIGMAPWVRPTDIESAPAQGVRDALGNPEMTDLQAARAARDAAIKFGGYIMGETEVAVPSNSMRSRAFIVGNSNPNTLWGFLRHSAGLFKGFIGSFMLTQLAANAEQASRGRFNARIGGRTLNLPHAAAIWIGMTALGVLAFSIKQMVTGKETPSLDPTTPEGRKTLIHGMLTGGAFGWMGDFLASDQDSYGHGPLESMAGAPASALIDAAQTGLDAFMAATTKTATSTHISAKERAIQGAFKTARFLTPAFSTLWWGRAAFNRMVLDQLQQMVDPGAHAAMREQERRLLKESNQKFWWRPGDILPHEYPWQHGK